MRAWLLLLGATLAGCGYLGSAEAWSPPAAGTDPHVLSDLEPLRQSEDWACGSAALAAVLRYHGSPLEQADVTERLAPRPKEGLTARALRDFARAEGFEAHIVRGTLADLKAHTRRGRPLIVGVGKPYAHGVLAHFEVVAGVEDATSRVLSLDPARGWTRNSAAGFLAEWAASGFVLLIIAPATP